MALIISQLSTALSTVSAQRSARQRQLHGKRTRAGSLMEAERAGQIELPSRWVKVLALQLQLIYEVN